MMYDQIIHAYSRADGILIDISDMAVKAGFRIPVAVTRTVWEKYIAWTDEETNRQTYQDQLGRIWDILFMLHMACRRSAEKSSLLYQLYVVPRDGKSRRTKPVLITLKSICSGGDSGEPVITIMMPDED